MKLHNLKAGDKLHQGAHFVIKVGHRFYAGEEIETREVVFTERNELGAIPKGVRWFDQARARWGLNDGFMRGSRAKRDRQKKSQASYLLNKRHKRHGCPKTTVSREITGRTSPRLVDDQTQAKKFRRKEQVETTCARLQTLYGESGAKVSVLYMGDSK